MMTPKDLLESAIEPAMAMLLRLTDIHSDDRALVLIMAIWGQESNWQYRLQGGGGSARGFPQFEGGSGAVGQLFVATPIQMHAVCDELMIPYDVGHVFQAIAWNDWLAACMTRLLLWQDPAALPQVGDQESAWEYYLRNWRPGAPDRGRWAARYPEAMEYVL